MFLEILPTCRHLPSGDICFGLWFYDLLIVYFVLIGLGLSISPGVSRPGHTLHLSFSFLFLGVSLDNLNVVSFFIL